MSLAALFIVAGLIFAVIAWEVWRSLPRTSAGFIPCPCCGSESRPLVLIDRDNGSANPLPGVRWCGVCRCRFSVSGEVK